MSTVRPPAHIDRYVELIGQDATIDLMLKYGGTFVHLAANPKDGAQIVKAVGRENALKLYHGADRLPARVPIAKRYIAQVWYLEKGWSRAEIARKLRVTNVTVSAYLKGVAKSDPGQMELF